MIAILNNNNLFTDTKVNIIIFYTTSIKKWHPKTFIEQTKMIAIAISHFVSLQLLNNLQASKAVHEKCSFVPSTKTSLCTILLKTLCSDNKLSTLNCDNNLYQH